MLSCWWSKFWWTGQKPPSLVRRDRENVIPCVLTTTTSIFKTFHTAFFSRFSEGKHTQIVYWLLTCITGVSSTIQSTLWTQSHGRVVHSVETRRSNEQRSSHNTEQSLVLEFPWQSTFYYPGVVKRFPKSRYFDWSIYLNEVIWLTIITVQTPRGSENCF